MPGVLEMVPGVRLVGQDREQVGRPDGEVGVEVHAAAAAAVVPVVAAPRLVVDQRDGQALPVGEAEEGGGAAPEARQQGVDDAPDASDGDHEAVVPRGEAGRERPAPGKERVELGGGRVEDALRGSGGPVVEAGGHVLEIGQPVAGEGPGLRFERDELDVEPAAPVGLIHLGGEAGAQRGGVVERGGPATAAAPRRRAPSGRPGRSSRRRGRRSAGRGAGRGGGSRGRPDRERGRRARRRPPGCGVGSPACPRCGRLARLHRCIRSGRGARGRCSAASWRAASSRASRTRAASSSASAGTSKRGRARDIARPLPGAHTSGLAAERHPLPLHRVEAHPERGRLLAGNLADVGRLLVRRHRAAPDDRPSACRPTARPGGSDPCSPRPRRASRRRAGARCAGRPWTVRRPGAHPRR